MVKHIVLFSGGVQSSYVAHLVSREYSDVILLFHDTKTEPLDNYRFKQEVANFLGLPITEQSDSRNIWQVFDDEGILGCNRVPVCSIRLKVEQGLKFYESLNDDFTVYVGYGINEVGRAQKIVARNPKIRYRFPLIESRVHKDGIKRIITNNWQICLPEMYLYFNHANCIPCVRGRKKHWRQVYYRYTEEYNKAVEYENKFGHTIMPDISLEKFKVLLLSDTQITFDDDLLPCICAV